MSCSQGKYGAVHRGTRGLDLAGVKLFRRWAAEATDSSINSRYPYHGMVNIYGSRMSVPAALVIGQATWSAIRQRARSDRARAFRSIWLATVFKTERRLGGM